MFENVNTVIFDMDGTVLNTLEDLTVSVNYVLSKFNMPDHSEEEYRKFFGNGIKYALKCAVTEETPEEVIEEMLPIFREHYNEHCHDRTKPYDGIIELMSMLRANGYKMAIVSNKIDSAVKELNDRFFSEYVDVAIGEKPGIKRKPAPDTVLAALDELGSKKEAAVYIGDSEVDLQTALNSELPCISVLWGFRDKDFLISKGASVFAETPEEVYDILKKIGDTFN